MKNFDKFIIHAIFNSEYTPNQSGDMYTSKYGYGQRMRYLDLNDPLFTEFENNKAGPPYTVFISPKDSSIIIAASRKGGSWVAHFNLNGERR